MSNYINKVSIYGMMNRLSFFDDITELGFYKKKDKSKIVWFKKRNLNEENYSQINYMYLDEDPHDKRAYYSEQIISKISETISTLPGKKFKEIRETRNKFNKHIIVKPISKDNINDVISMIEEWRYLENGGWKYGFNEHAAIDKSIVQRYVETDLSNHIYAFSFYYNNKCVGYSTIEKHPSDIVDNLNEYKYLTRKALLIKGLRNLTEYIDWYTFNFIYKSNNNNDFLINWGCSSGGVKWYKTHKWPLYKLEKKWFLTIKNNDKSK